MKNNLDKNKTENETENITNFDSVTIPVVSEEISEVLEENKKEDNESVKKILEDMNASESSVQDASVPENTDLDISGMISPDDCTALLHTIYNLVAFAVNGTVPQDNIISWRGKQMHIIMLRYKLNVRYLDLMFFGLGIVSDCMLIYQSRKKSEPKEENKTEFIPPVEETLRI